MNQPAKMIEALLFVSPQPVNEAELAEGADAAADEALAELEIDLETEDFSDTDRWEEVKVNAYRVNKGDTVRVARGHEGGGEEDRIYRYIGVNNMLLMADEDYSDESRWQLAPVEVSVSVIEEGKRWKLVDAAGKSYTLTFNEAPSGSAAASTAVVSRNSINAVSVAASAAIGISGGGSGLAFSGAGAVAGESWAARARSKSCMAGVCAGTGCTGSALCWARWRASLRARTRCKARARRSGSAGLSR